MAAAVLSNRYIADRFLPDKAIDLSTRRRRSCAWRSTRCRRSSTRSQRRIMQLEIEREALRKEKDKASKERLGKLEKELADLKEERDAARGALAAGEGRDPAGARKLKEELEAGAAARSSARSAPATTRRRRSCSTAACPQLEQQIQRARKRGWPSCRRASAC